jgi:hypothetical protein
MISACVAEAYQMAPEIVLEPPPPTSNNAFVAGMLTTAQQIETFCDMVEAMVDTGGSCSMGMKTTDFKKNYLCPSSKAVKTYNGDLKAGQHSPMQALMSLFH